MLALFSTAVLPCLALAEAPWKVTVGRSFSFLTNPEGKGMATGSNKYGQLGIDSMDDVLVPTDLVFPVGYDNNIKEIAAGAFHSVILHNSGAVFVAGRNDRGQLGVGNNNPGDGSLKHVTSLGTNVTAVAAGYAHSVFLMKDGTVQTAGWNSAGQLGNSHEANGVSSNVPVLVDFNQADDTVTGIAAGYDFTYIMTDKHGLYGFGQNLGHQLGIRRGSNFRAPVLLAGGVKAIAAGESHGVYVDVNGHLWATGANYDGQFGNGNRDNTQSFVDTTNANVGMIGAGGDSTCISRNNQLSCMGSNRFGQLGQGGDTLYFTTATALGEVTLATGIAVGESHSFFIDHNIVYVTGLNNFGQLGLNNTENKVSPATLIEGVGTRPPTPAPVPTPAPTPRPTPGTTGEPTEEPTRNPLSRPDVEGRFNWSTLVILGVVCMIVVGILVRLGNVGDKPEGSVETPQAGEETTPASSAGAAGIEVAEPDRSQFV